jgi:hypothetical protein
MVRPFAFVVVTVAMAGVSGCTVAAPNAGHQAVWMEKPFFFGHGGVDQTPVTAGREYGAITSEAIDVDMLPQRVDMEFDDMMTSSGVPVSFHVVATFKVTDPVRLVSGFGADRDDKGGWGFWTRNLDQPLQNAVREEAGYAGNGDLADCSRCCWAGGECGGCANSSAVRTSHFVYCHQCRARESTRCD